jgi:predicted ATP-grasp superfamily ATP-dependent carboligase
MDGVFITDGYWRKTLAAVRALGGEGVRVVVGEFTRFAPALFSRFARRAVVYENGQTTERAFAESIAECARVNGCGVVMPMEEDTLLALARNRDVFGGIVELPCDSAENIEFARDKARVIEHALKIGIACPKTLRADELAGTDGVKRVEAEVGFPAVIKPRVSSGARGLRYVECPEDFAAAYAEVHARFPNPLVQERLPGEGDAVCVSVLRDRDSIPRAVFTHRRLRQYPVEGGASTLRVGIRLPELESEAVRLLKSMNWFGVACVEFKRDVRDGRYKLMEVNPRFWGSLSLAVESGVNFPMLLYRLARGEKLGYPPDYRPGMMTRWMIPGDVMHFLRSPERFRMKPGFLELSGRKLRHETFRADDPFPLVGLGLSLVPFLFDGRMRKFHGR